MAETKTKLSLSEKADLLKSRATKFSSFIKNRYMAGQPLAAQGNIDAIDEIWNEIKEQMQKEIEDEKNRER